LGTLVHRSLLLRPSFTRHFSSNSKNAKPSSAHRQSTPSLPPEKLRALISLYHQSRDLITPSNLSEKIDEIFSTGHFSSNSSGTFFASKRELDSALEQRNTQPRIGEPSLPTYTSERTWNALRSRENEVYDAIYGVDKLRNPGLDALLDEEKKIQQMLREDKQASSEEV